MERKNERWTEAERLAEIDRLKQEYTKLKKDTEMNLLEMRRIRKQIDVVEDALIIQTVRRWRGRGFDEPEIIHG